MGFQKGSRATLDLVWLPQEKRDTMNTKSCRQFFPASKVNLEFNELFFCICNGFYSRQAAGAMPPVDRGKHLNLNCTSLRLSVAGCAPGPVLTTSATPSLSLPLRNCAKQLGPELIRWTPDCLSFCFTTPEAKYILVKHETKKGNQRRRKKEILFFPYGFFPAENNGAIENPLKNPGLPKNRGKGKGISQMPLGNSVRIVKASPTCLLHMAWQC